MPKAVAKQLAKKMKLEKKLKPKLRQFFNQISTDIKTVWSATRSIPSLSSFSLELTALLRNHYRDVAKEFSNSTRESLKSSHPDLILKQEEEDDSLLGLSALLLLGASDEISRSIIAYITAHSELQSGFILRTTERELQSIAATTITEAQGQGLDSREIGNLIQENFNERTESRIDLIAETETQTTSEAIKLIEATALATLLTPQPGTQQLFKTWNAVLDSRTRPTHVAANNQKVPADGVFRVGGARMNAPGDTSLGAPLKEVVRCRCVAIYSVEGAPEAPLIDILQ